MFLSGNLFNTFSWFIILITPTCHFREGGNPVPFEIHHCHMANPPAGSGLLQFSPLFNPAHYIAHPHSELQIAIL